MADRDTVIVVNVILTQDQKVALLQLANLMGKPDMAETLKALLAEACANEGIDFPQASSDKP